MPIFTNGSYENLVYGEDGVSPLKGALERYLGMAAKDACRLRIEVRVKPQGAPSSQQEHQWEVDTTEVTVDGLLRHICDKLDESPGEAFAGEIRMNFSQAGSSGTRYGSFTRTVYPASTAGNYQGANPGFGGGFQGGGGFPGNGGGGYPGGGGGGGGGFRRSPGGDEDVDDGDGEDEIENASGELDTDSSIPSARFPRMGRGGPPMAPVGGGGIWMDEAALRTWLETVWGFNFRQQASMLAMFDRATKMMEAIALRFGMPEAVQPRAIVDTRAAPAAAESAAGLGILPMLLKAAAHLANSESPAEVAQKAGSLATGEPPPDGAARALAVRGAAGLVRSLRAGGRPAPPAAPATPAPGVDPEDDGGGGAAYDEGEDYENDGSENEEEEYDENEYDESDDGDDAGSGGAEFEDLPPDALMQKLQAWVQKDPSRKGEIMKRAPQLMKLME